MKSLTINRTLLSISIALTLSQPDDGYAAPSAERARQAVRSIRGELFETELSVVRSEPSNVRAAEALSTLSPLVGYRRGEVPPSRIEGSRLRANDGNFTFVIDEIASSGRLFRLSAPGRARPAGERASDEELFAQGRALITGLGAILPRGPQEDLVPDAVMHQHGVSGDDRGQGEPVWMGSRVTFMRTVDGLPVLGREPALAIEFDAEGELISLEYSWRLLSKTSEKKRTETRARVFETLHSRATLLAPKGSAPAGLLPVPEMSERFVPFSLSNHAVMEELRCGYLMTDDENTSDSALRVGCIAHVTPADSTSTIPPQAFEMVVETQ